MSLKSTNCLLLSTLLAIGCSSPVSADPRDYVGEYVFIRPSGAAKDNFASFVVLKPDQTAVEVYFDGATGEVFTKDKKWSLWRGTEENLAIGDFSHPIRGSGSSVKLSNSEDFGEYYQKIR